MCVASNIMDNQIGKWQEKYPNIAYTKPYPEEVWLPGPAPPTQAEIEEFRKLLTEAREADRLEKTPDCDSEAKKQVLRDMAKFLKINISFIEDEQEGRSP